MRRAPDLVKRSREIYRDIPTHSQSYSSSTVDSSPRSRGGGTSMVSSTSEGSFRARGRSHSSPNVLESPLSFTGTSQQSLPFSYSNTSQQSMQFERCSDQYLSNLDFTDRDIESTDIFRPHSTRSTGLGTSIKKMKRRTKAGLLEWTGRIPETVDPLFEFMKDSFADAVVELRDLNRNMRDVIQHTRTLAESSAHVLQGIGVSFPGEKTKGGASVLTLKAQHVEETDAIVKTLVEVLDPLNNLVKVQIPWLEKKIQERGVARSEYDFYKHRVSELEKTDKYENELKLQKYKKKKSASELVYNSLNKMITSSMKEFLEVKPLLVEKYVSQAITSQRQIVAGMQARIGLVDSYLPKQPEEEGSRLEEMSKRFSAPRNPLSRHGHAYVNSMVWKPASEDFTEYSSPRLSRPHSSGDISLDHQQYQEEQRRSHLPQRDNGSPTSSQSSVQSFDSGSHPRGCGNSDIPPALPNPVDVPEHEYCKGVAPAGLGRASSVGFASPPPLPPAETAVELTPVLEESQQEADNGLVTHARSKSKDKPHPALDTGTTVSDHSKSQIENFDSEPFAFTPPPQTGHGHSKSEFTRSKPLPPPPKAQLNSNIPITVIAQDDLRLSETGSEMGNFMMQATSSAHKSLPSPRPSQKIFGVEAPTPPLEAMVSLAPKELKSPTGNAIATMAAVVNKTLDDDNGDDGITSPRAALIPGAVAALPMPRSSNDKAMAIARARMREREFFQEKVKQKEDENAKAAELESALSPQDRERLRRERDAKQKHEEQKSAALKHGMQRYASAGSDPNKFKRMPTKRRTAQSPRSAQ